MISIGPPDADADELITMPIHGMKETDKTRLKKNAYENALHYFESANKVEGDSRIVLSAFACELFFKAIRLKLNQTPIHSHDLYELYEALDFESAGLLLVSYEGILTQEELENFICLHAQAFVTFRYKYEMSDFVFVEDFLLELAENLNLVYWCIEEDASSCK